MADDRKPTAEEVKANVAKANAEAELALAGATKWANEARQSAADAELAELKLVEARHEADRAREKRSKELSDNEHHHVYYFKGGVDQSSTDNCIKALDHWVRTAEENDEKPGEITIIMFSPGGGVMAGMNLFDHILALREKGWKFTAVTRGYAASMGGILLQAADVRKCGPESYILIHEISSGAVGKIGELEDEVEFIKLIQNRVNNIFVQRSNGKVTASKLRAMYRRKDFWLDSKKALELGIVDEIG